MLEALVAAGEQEDTVSAPRIPSSPTELFYCTTYDLNLLGSACVRRQQTDPTSEENKHRWCAGGECEQGCRVWQALQGEPRPDAKVVDLEKVRVAPLHCRLCGRRLNANNDSGVCAPDRHGNAHCNPNSPRPMAVTVTTPPGVTPEQVAAAVQKAAAAPKPDPIVYRCEECGRELAQDEREACARCRAEDTSAAVAPPPPPPPPPAAPLTHPETTMAEETETKTCPHCGKQLRSDNKRGACSKCLARGKAAAGEPELERFVPKSKPAREAPEKQAVLGLGVAVTRELPDVTELPTDYLMKAVNEFVRRRDEMLQLSRKLGLATPAAAAVTEAA